ncbi:uncharacterized protein K452DRAFT_219118 [Aplosporella prunicola CBS 121167]|uniref:U three protein 23 n=1 Tax=Aplosporella prunicola CBS 121167 TaxID=1176127 RepID=A0A6A6BUG9_9PEZI|nr:uncharacterized protein K452DRAFT_219118 [Aplosporella prunicola CBS 121167]KAF2146874.1 hypothetical protein K452DRAFT_219118 [Aplosporella prunicola CBS 121167]
MRGKRAKQYRKLMHQYGLTFGFREPYQVLVDAQMVQDAERFKMDLAGGLERTLQGKIKPMITHCSMRHLYEAKDQTVIAHAKSFERRRCNHHELEKPLSTLECIQSVVDPKGANTNKHRYCVATQDPKVRAFLRKIPGVPLVYINRSVMIMEPMGGATEDVRDRAEKDKFRAGIKGTRRTAAELSAKRKRDEDGDDSDVSMEDATAGAEAEGNAALQPKKKQKKGPKGPNPLSVKKPKDKPTGKAAQKPNKAPEKPKKAIEESETKEPSATDTAEEPAKRKRKRKNKPKTDGESAEAAQADAQES